MNGGELAVQDPATALRVIAETRAPGRFVILDTREHRAVIPGGALPDWQKIGDIFDAPDGGVAFIRRFWPGVTDAHLAYLPYVRSIIKNFEASTDGE